jgi:O-antigen ligase
VRADLIALVGLFACAAIFYAAPWPFLYIPALIATAALALRYPVHSLALVPAFAPFFMQPKHIGHLRPAPQEIFLVVALCALTVGMTRGSVVADWAAVRRSLFLWPAMVFVFAAGVSAMASLDSRLALRALYQVVLEPVLYGALLVLFLRTGRDWALVLGAAAVSCVFVSCAAVGEAIAQPGHSLSPVASFQHAVGFYGSPDNLGLLLDRVIPFWLAFALFAPLRGRLRAALILAGLPLLVGLLYSYSRGAWLATGVACVLLLVLRPGWTRYAAIALVVLGGLASLAKAHSVVDALSTGHAGTGQKRIDIWRSSLNMLRDHPILGVGLDNFKQYYSPRHGQQAYTQDNCWGKGYIIEPGASSEPCLSHPHNEVLDFWLSTGIMGLAAGLAATVLFWRALYLAWHRRADAWARALVLAAGTAMLASLLHGLVDNSYFLMDLSVLFWTFCALAGWIFSRGKPVVERPA